MTTVSFEGADRADAELGLVASLQARLAEQLAALRRRGGVPASLDARIALVGGLMVAAGAVLVLLGWYGASHTSRVYLQIPYLISGGLFGVVLAFAGGCAYLASWLTRLVQDERVRADEAVAASREVAAALGRIEALLAGGTAEVPGAPRTPGGSLVAEGYVATPSGRLAHLRSCPTVVGRADLRSVDVGPDGLALCRMCNDPDLG